MEKDGVRTVEEWADQLERTREGKSGQFRLLSRDMLNSPAFIALSKAGLIVVLAMLEKIRYPKKGKDRKGVKVGTVQPLNEGKFVLTVNELQARGLSPSSATRGRNMAWEIGFFDVVRYGSIHNASVFRYSERWKHYPDGEYKPVGQPPPGKNVYPQFGFGNRDHHGDSSNQDEIYDTHQIDV